MRWASPAATARTFVVQLIARMQLAAGDDTLTFSSMAYTVLLRGSQSWEVAVRTYVCSNGNQMTLRLIAWKIGWLVG